MSIPHQEMADALDGMARAKADWLSKFASGRTPRPAHEIERKRADLAVLRQAAEDYRRAAQRGAA